VHHRHYESGERRRYEPIHDLHPHLDVNDPARLEYLS
jgi:hypothetical protein